MKGYTIQRSIELLEKNSGQGGSGASSAADVSYINGTSGLAASNVQSAIDEIVGRDVYSTSERVVGKWIDNSPVYEKVVDTGVLPNATTKNVAHGIENLGQLISANGVAQNTQASTFLPIPQLSSNSSTNNANIILVNSTNIVIQNNFDFSQFYDKSFVILRYTKAEPTKTRKTKKEESK